MSYSKDDAEIVRILAVDAGSPNRALIALALRTPVRTLTGLGAAFGGLVGAVNWGAHMLPHLH